MSDDRSLFFEKGYLFEVFVFAIEKKEEKEKGGGRKRERGRKTANEAKKGTCIYLVLSLCLSGFWKAPLYRSLGGLSD